MKAFLNPWVLLGLVALLLATGSLAYWKGGQHKAQELAAQLLSDEAIANKAAVAMAGVVQEAVAAHKGKTTVITNQAETVVKENTVYRECKIDSTMQDLIRQAGERHAE